VGSDDYDVGAGTWVTVPPGAPHTFANPGDDPAVMLTTFTPDLYAHYFRDVKALLDSGQPMTRETHGADLEELRHRTIHRIRDVTSGRRRQPSPLRITGSASERREVAGQVHARSACSAVDLAGALDHRIHGPIRTGAPAGGPDVPPAADPGLAAWAAEYRADAAQGPLADALQAGLAGAVQRPSRTPEALYGRPPRRDMPAACRWRSPCSSPAPMAVAGMVASLRRAPSPAGRETARARPCPTTTD